MTLHLFEDQPVADYVRAIRRAANFWLFHHVPKTAGSSMSAELRELLSPYRNVHVDPDHAPAPQPVRMARATEAFLAAHADSPFRAASGHFRAQHIETIRAAIPDVRMFTMLRDPVERVVSEYRYMCTPRHPTQAAHIERYPTLESYVEDAATANKMSLYLAVRKPTEAASVIAHVKANYTFAGFLDDYELSFRFLTMLMFSPVPPRPQRVNETVSTERNAVALDPALAELIRARNFIDVELYETLRAIYDARREEMVAAVEEARRS